jgi:hypothetical protein
MRCDGKEGLGLDSVDCYYSEMARGLCDCGAGVGGVMEGMTTAQGGAWKGAAVASSEAITVPDMGKLQGTWPVGWAKSPNTAQIPIFAALDPSGASGDALVVSSNRQHRRSSRDLVLVLWPPHLTRGNKEVSSFLWLVLGRDTMRLDSNH